MLRGLQLTRKEFYWATIYKKSSKNKLDMIKFYNFVSLWDVHGPHKCIWRSTCGPWAVCLRPLHLTILKRQNIIENEKGGFSADNVDFKERAKVFPNPHSLICLFLFSLPSRVNVIKENFVSEKTKLVSKRQYLEKDFIIDLICIKFLDGVQS
jgi:hypothetical protein